MAENPTQARSDAPRPTPPPEVPKPTGDGMYLKPTKEVQQKLDNFKQDKAARQDAGLAVDHRGVKTDNASVKTDGRKDQGIVQPNGDGKPMTPHQRAEASAAKQYADAQSQADSRRGGQPSPEAGSGGSRHGGLGSGGHGQRKDAARDDRPCDSSRPGDGRASGGRGNDGRANSGDGNDGSGEDACRGDSRTNGRRGGDGLGIRPLERADRVLDATKIQNDKLAMDGRTLPNRHDEQRATATDQTEPGGKHRARPTDAAASPDGQRRGDGNLGPDNTSADANLDDARISARDKAEAATARRAVEASGDGLSMRNTDTLRSQQAADEARADTADETFDSSTDHGTAADLKGVHRNEHGERVFLPMADTNAPEQLTEKVLNQFSSVVTEHTNRGEPIYRTVGMSDTEFRDIVRGVDDCIARGLMTAEDRRVEINTWVDQVYEEKAKSGEWFTPSPSESVDSSLQRSGVATEWHSTSFGRSVNSGDVQYRQYEVLPAGEVQTYVGKAKPNPRKISTFRWSRVWIWDDVDVVVDVG
jgi:hypothetical protein